MWRLLLKNKPLLFRHSFPVAIQLFQASAFEQLCVANKINVETHFRTKITLFNKKTSLVFFSENDDLVEFSSRMAVEYKNTRISNQNKTVHQQLTK